MPPLIPTIEQRATKRGKRFYVVGVLDFAGSQLHGFKSPEALLRCWKWWLWKYHPEVNAPTRIVRMSQSCCKVKAKTNDVPDMVPVADDDAPDWMD